MNASSAPKASSERTFVVAITGGSGAVYSLRLLDVLLSAGHRVLLSISPAGAAVIEQELAQRVRLEALEPADLLPLGGEEEHVSEACELAGVRAPIRLAAGQLVYYHHQDLFASIASGSSRTDGMVICPCSGGTVSAIAHGASTNLIHRAADVHLKERRKLILVPRETPLSTIQLDNLRRCAEAGAVVLPAMPGWYHGVRQVSDLVDFVVARICDQLGVPNELVRRWGVAES